MVVGADHDAIGMQEVVDSRALAEELGVGHHLHIVPPEHALDDPSRADGDRRLVHDDGLVRERGADLAGHVLDVGEVGGAVRALRRRHAQVGKLTSGGGGGVPHDERQSAAVETRPQELLEPGLEDRHLAPRESLHLARVDVGADHVVPEVGEAGTRRQPDVPRADDGNRAHSFTPRRPSRSHEPGR